MADDLERFHSLKAIGSLLNFFGYVIAVIGMLAGLATLHTAEPYANIVSVAMVAGGLFIGGFLSGALMVGIGKTLHVLVAIEKNTREM